MFSKNLIAAGALLSVVAAVPMVKRDIVWITEVDNEVVTKAVTQTVWVNPGDSVPTTGGASPTYHGHHRHPLVSPPAAPSAPASSSEAAPASTSSSSSFVAPSSKYVTPDTTSTSVYVAPTPSSTSTSVWVAPTTSTSVWVAPTTSSAPVWSAPSTTTQASSPTSYEAPAAAATCTNAASGSSITGVAAQGASFSGDFTYYATGMGACGCTSVDGDAIVAISQQMFDQYMPSSGNPNLNPLCGRQLALTGADGQTHVASIVDRCTGCAMGDLDLTQTFFNKVTNYGDGRVHNMKWSFIN